VLDESRKGWPEGNAGEVYLDKLFTLDDFNNGVECNFDINETNWYDYD